MKPLPPITVWKGCDQSIAQACEAMSSRWGPYTTTTRRYPMRKLLEELVDPAWLTLRSRISALSDDSLARAWARYRNAAVLRNPRIDMAGLTGTSPLSEISHRLGFAELDLFIKAIARTTLHQSRHETSICLGPSLDTLREIAIRCGGKKTKYLSYGKFGKVELLDGMFICRSCAQATELAAHKAEYGDSPPEGPGRPSRTYCPEHRPKRKVTNFVRSDYQRARRSQARFETELKRLERQCRGRPPSAHARTGSSLVDEFYLKLMSKLSLTDEQALNCDESDFDKRESYLRPEARLLVDERISDRKKEIVVLLSKGLSQAQVAQQLGLKSRQAISQAINSIPNRYRLDLNGPPDWPMVPSCLQRI